MMLECQAPIPDGILSDYWTGDLHGDEMNRVEEHVFACGDCSARLQQVAALGAGLSALVRQGRVSGIVSRAMLNRLQRDGAHVRMYWLAPGETVPCAVFPDDDVIVTALRADFSGVDSVTLSVTGPADTPFGRCDDVPVSGPRGEVLWANPAALLRQLPTMRLELTLTSTGAAPTELGRYVLEHSALPPPA
jgi:putative zinc finger protein